MWRHQIEGKMKKFKAPKARRYTTAQVVAEIAKDPKARFRLPAKDGKPAYKIASREGNPGQLVAMEYYSSLGWIAAFLPQSSNWLRVMPGSKVAAVLTVGKDGTAVVNNVAAGAVGEGKHVLRVRKVDSK